MLVLHSSTAGGPFWDKPTVKGSNSTTERFNEQQELYGSLRLPRQLETPGTNDPVQVLKQIVDDLARFAGDRPADDDQAMVLLVAE